MNHRFAYLMAAGLALAAGPRAEMSASPALHSVADVDVLVDGAPERRYAHDGRWYVEARKGREYAIRLRNPYVDPMSLVQVDLLRRKRAGENTDALNYALGATINGIAAGLHNTG